MLDFLQRDPWGFLQFMLYRAPAVLLALTLAGAPSFRAANTGARLWTPMSPNPPEPKSHQPRHVHGQ